MKSLALTVCLCLGLAQSVLAADITITDARVDIYYSYRPASFTAASVGWSFPVSLTAGQDLVLTQNTGTYSFDTSDAGCEGYPLAYALCDTGWALISLKINGTWIVFWDLNRVLTLGGRDPLDPKNEAQEYSPAYSGPGFDVWLGYADNIHTDPCGSYPHSMGLFGAVTCLPSPFEHVFDSDRPTYFQGQSVPLEGLIQTEPHHCVVRNLLHGCYDAPAIRVVAHTEPSKP